MSVKAGTGRRSQLTSEGKDFPKSLCKTTADPAADSGTQAAAALLGLPWKVTDFPHLSSSQCKLPIHKGKTLKLLENGSRRKQRQQQEPLRYDRSGMWLRLTVCEQTRLWCLWQQQTDSRVLPTEAWCGPENRNSIVYTMTCPMHDSYCACKVEFILAGFTEIMFYYVNMGSHKEVHIDVKDEQCKKWLRNNPHVENLNKYNLSSSLYRCDKQLVCYLIGM